MLEATAAVVVEVTSGSGKLVGLLVLVLALVWVWVAWDTVHTNTHTQRIHTLVLAAQPAVTSQTEHPPLEASPPDVSFPTPTTTTEAGSTAGSFNAG